MDHGPAGHPRRDNRATDDPPTDNPTTEPASLDDQEADGPEAGGTPAPHRESGGRRAAARRLWDAIRWPDRPLRRVAWLFMVFGLLAMGGFAVVVVGASTHSVWWRALSLFSTAVLLAMWVLQYRVDRILPWSSLVEALAIVGVSRALERPDQAVIAAFASVTLHALYQPAPRLVVHTLLVCGAVLGGTLLELAIGHPVVIRPLVWQLPLVGMVAVIDSAIGSVLRDQERAVNRERALATAGTELVAAADRAEIYDSALDCLLALFDRRDDLRVAMWVGDEEELTAVATAGSRAEQVLGMQLDIHALPAELIPLREEPHVVYAPDPARVAIGFPPKTGGLVVASLPVVPRAFLAVAGDRPIPEEAAGAVHALAAGVALALESLARTEDLQASEARFRALVQNSSDAITVIGPDTTITYASPSVRGVLGIDPAALTGRPLEELVHPEDRSKLVAFMRRVAKPGRTVPLGCRMRHADGAWLEIDSIGTNLQHLPAVGGIVLNSRDVSERKALERQLSIRAYYDSLTRLANRALLLLQIRRALARSERSGQPVALLLLDMDGFKMLNDSLGHLAGDEVLVAVAERIRACVRPHDTPARLGGDEFAVLLEDIDGPDPAVGVARRVIAQFSRPIHTSAGHDVYARGSIGVALSGPEARTPDDLIRNADVAMYMAKADGVGGYRQFEPSMHADVSERLGLETGLHRAIERGELVVHYQPIVRLADRRVLGVEALVRWQHPELGLLPPQRFVPVAEDTGVIVAVGAWVLRAAARQVRHWQQSHPLPDPVSVSVNVSARQLQQADLTGQVRSILRDTGLDPRQLVLELTESLLVQHTEASIAKLEELKRLGVRLAIDDFGTGFSSLGYLRRFPFDILKIDRSFVQGADVAASDDAALAHAIVQIGHALGLETLAEGIETQSQLEAVRRFGCAQGQGYHLAPPLAPERMEALLADAAGRDGQLDPSGPPPPRTTR